MKRRSFLQFLGLATAAPAALAASPERVIGKAPELGMGYSAAATRPWRRTVTYRIDLLRWQVHYVRPLRGHEFEWLSFVEDEPNEGMLAYLDATAAAAFERALSKGV